MAPQFTYTGQYDLHIIDNRRGYVRLLTSGALTFNQNIFIDAYLLGGGGDGADGRKTGTDQDAISYGSGGGGTGYATNMYNIPIVGGESQSITIGAKGSDTKAFDGTAGGGSSASGMDGGDGGNGGDFGVAVYSWTGAYHSEGREGDSQLGAPDTTYAFNRDMAPFDTMDAPPRGVGFWGNGAVNGGKSAAANSGGGGYGHMNSGRGGSGGSGIVIIRWGFTESTNLANLNPSSGFANEKIENKFTWTLDSIPPTDTQQSAIFQWRARGASVINTINVGTTQSATVPSNTLPNGEFEWRVSATNTAGIVAPFTEWFLLTTVDQKPNKPTGLYPNTGSRDGTKVMQFSWIHNSPLSTPQSAFEVKITYDGGTTWRALSNKVTTAVTQFTAAANTILPTDPTGRIGWRVRSYNSDNVASDWSDTAFFIVHPAPQAPNWISVEAGRSRPLSRWTSLMQVGFQLQVLAGEVVLFDSGEIHGTQTEYRIPIFLNNGLFTFRVRIKNIRGLYSDWANRAVSINARHSLNITLRGNPVEGGAALDFDVEVRADG